MSSHPSQPEIPDDLARGWFEACLLPPVDAAIRGVHAELADEVAHRKPVCVSSGRCCHFEAFGHRLYVTGLETAWTLSQLSGGMDGDLIPTPEEVEGATAAGTCPFLTDALCSIHAIKPMACRLFFCDETSTGWQSDLYEQLQASIQKIHHDHDIPYRYGEWRTMLQQCLSLRPGINANTRRDDPDRAEARRRFTQVRLS